MATHWPNPGTESVKLRQMYIRLASEEAEKAVQTTPAPTTGVAVNGTSAEVGHVEDKADAPLGGGALAPLSASGAQDALPKSEAMDISPPTS